MIRRYLEDCFERDLDQLCCTDNVVAFRDEEMFWYFGDYLTDKDISFCTAKNSYVGLYVIELR